MCGLVGVINTTKYGLASFDNWFKHALIADSVRGKHSTGVFTVEMNYNSTLWKQAINGIEAASNPTVVSLLSKSNRVLMGHNRYATHGKISDNNAHPFQHGHITLCHNGTLSYFKHLNKDKVFDVDSEAITYLLSKEELVPSLEKLEGAFALTWYNSYDKTFNIARNSERDVYIARVNEGSGEGTWLYASEKGMLTWLADKNGIKIDEPILVPVGKVLTWTLNGEKKTYETTDFTPKPKAVTNYYTSKSYSDYYGTNNSPQTASSHLKKLIGKVYEVFFYSYSSYPCSPFGVCYGGVANGSDSDSDLNFSLSGVHREEAMSLLKKTEHTRVKVTGVSKDGELYVTDKGIEPEKKIIILPSSNNITIEELDAMDKELNDIMANDTTISKNQKKRFVGSCTNCDSDLNHGDKVYLAWNGKFFCSDCAQLYPDYLDEIDHQILT